MAYVYRHIRLDLNEVFYIGIGTDERYKRANEKARRSDWWKKIVSKSEYRIEILFDDVDVQFAKEKEIELISIYGRRDMGLGPLVNMTDGGDGLMNRVFTDEYREKLSRAAKARVVSDDQKDKLRKMHLGRRHSEETKRKMSESKIANPYVATESLRKNRSDRMKANNPSSGKFGIHSKNFKGYVLAIKDGNIVGRFEGVYDASRHLSIEPTKISACVNGRVKACKGYVFKREAA